MRVRVLVLMVVVVVVVVVVRWWWCAAAAAAAGGGGRCPNTCPLLLACRCTMTQLKMEPRSTGASVTSRCDFRVFFLSPKACRAAAGDMELASSVYAEK